MGCSCLIYENKPIVLKDVMCVTNINKNMISVYSLCNTNKVLVELFPSSFKVKDLTTGTRLIQGNTKGQLYEWPRVTSTPTAFFTSPTSKATMFSWNSRLGHPSFSI